MRVNANKLLCSITENLENNRNPTGELKHTKTISLILMCLLTVPPLVHAGSREPEAMIAMREQFKTANWTMPFPFRCRVINDVWTSNQTKGLSLSLYLPNNN